MRCSRLGAPFLLLVAAIFFPRTASAQCSTITVNPATIPAGIAATNYSQTFTQTGGTEPVSFSESGALPNGMVFSEASATLSGIPTQVGAYPITINVLDTNGCTGSRNYSLVIGCQTITLTPTSFPKGRQGFAYSQQIGQTGGIGTMTFALGGETMPGGMLFNTANGTLSGTPTESGTFYMTFIATDSNGCRRTGLFPLLVTNTNGVGPFGLNVDAAGNGMIDPGEAAVLAPAWYNNTGGVVTIGGVMSNFSGPPGATYTLFDASAAYGTVANNNSVACISDCYQAGVDNPTVRPAQHWDASAIESLSPAIGSAVWTLHIGGSFTDVPQATTFYPEIETLLHNGVTSGCTTTTFCPANSVTRSQMAVFVLRSMDGPSYTPPACTTPLFNDVPASNPFCRWIEEMARRGITGGCGGGAYCPNDPVTRSQMAVFLIRSVDGNAYNPPDCTGTFGDVPTTSFFCRYIEEIARRGITSGCAPGSYCPNNPITRQQMAAFLVRTFSLDAYKP